ncbi:MAG: hypothetical protein HF314_12400 [Ignavibacteria bacterium]|jgi:hypothetical protein|nr:hypothetical protein [Ignavibacteria bacterium]MCU7503873.1 hypothetical protein [Ignavibacteria bacterium]MCU7515906.1 hypothetical protein [Ignavibacteria bacterium]
MELIPILSFIILVATISTFILAIGAYILYKMRERKGRTSAAPVPRYIEAELLTPNQAALQQGTPAMQAGNMMQPGGQVIYQEQYQRQVPEMRTPVLQPQQTSQGRTVAQQVHARQQDYQMQQPSGDEYEENPANKKFMKYTSEGYVPVNKTKTGENLKWR